MRNILNKQITRTFISLRLQAGRQGEKERKKERRKKIGNLFGFLVKHGKNTCWIYSTNSNAFEKKICLKMHLLDHNERCLFVKIKQRSAFTCAMKAWIFGRSKPIAECDLQHVTMHQIDCQQVHITYNLLQIHLFSQPIQTAFSWATKRAVLLFFYHFLFVWVVPSPKRRRVEKKLSGIKNSIFIRKYSLYANISHTSLSQIAIFCEPKRGGNMNSTSFFILSFALHYLIWNSTKKKWATHTRWTGTENCWGNFIWKARHMNNMGFDLRLLKLLSHKFRFWFQILTLC